MLPLVIATAQPGATLATNSVDFVDKNDAGRIFLGVVKHVPDACRTHTDKHFDKIRSGNREKRNLRLARNAFGQQGFACAGGANQQEAAGDSATELLEFLRVLEEVNHLFHFFLGLIASGHIGKRHLVGVFVQHTGLALAEAEGATFAAALHLPHEVHPDPNQQQHRAPADQQCHQQGAFFAGFDVKFDAIGDQVTD